MSGGKSCAAQAGPQATCTKVLTCSNLSVNCTHQCAGLPKAQAVQSHVQIGLQGLSKHLHKYVVQLPISRTKLLRFPGHHYNRVGVTAAGCCIWGICTLSFSFCSSLNQGYVFWAANGLGLSLVIPAGQSLIADYHCASSRGTAFGAYYLTAAFGSMFGSLYATNVGESSWHCLDSM